MSFRLFIYYCAVCGGLAAYVGWVFGRMSTGEGGDDVSETALKGMLLGMLLALGLSAVDGLWQFSARHALQVGLRVVVASLIGALGGLLGGAVGQVLYRWLPILLIVGWTITGLLIGASLGVFDLLSVLLLKENTRGARRRMINGLLGGTVGGTVGGMLGGLLFLFLKVAWTGIFRNKPAERLWSPSATGFVALGLCIGLFIGLAIVLAQVILKEAWVRVEKGFRTGRQFILTKDEITIGRAEGCDIGLFGDNGVERTHARILLQENGYMLADAGTAAGTYLNGKRVLRPTPLRSGDEIQVGNSILSFGERQKRTQSDEE